MNNGRAKQRPTVDELKEALGDVRRRRRRRHWLVGLTVVLALAAGAGFLASDRYFTLVSIRGNGMRRTLENGSVALCQRTRKFDYGSLVLLRVGDTLQVRRVIGLPDDVISIDPEGKVKVNGWPLDEPYVMTTGGGRGDQPYPVLVPERCLFVLGDHRSTAVDSRFASFGMVSIDTIVGQPRCVVWPVFRIGMVR